MRKPILAIRVILVTLALVLCSAAVIAVMLARVGGWPRAQSTATPISATPTSAIAAPSRATPAPPSVTPSTPAGRTTPATADATPTPTGALPAPTAAGPAPAEPAAFLAYVQSIAVPTRDLADLARRLKPQPAATPAAAATPGTRVAGSKETFWVAGMDTMTHFTVTATLRVVSDYLYMYVDDRVANVSSEALRASADVFDQQTHPTTRSYFGDAWAAGLDGDRRITILHTRQFGAAGAFSSADEESPAGNPYSNGRHMIYMNVEELRPGTRTYNSVLAHEFQHAIHFFQDRNEDAWVNEGASMLNEQLNGYSGGQSFIQAFTAFPDTQLTDWSDEPDTSAHYGAAYAFLAYVHQRYGDQALRWLIEEDANGAAGFDRVLARLGVKERFNDVFADWMTANLLDDPGLAGGIYGYDDLTVRLKANASIAALPVTTQAAMPQYAAYYVQITPPQGQATIVISAATQTRLTSNEAHSGAYQWWSNRGDLMNTSLTRAFDLTGLRSASLTFWTWYDVEEGWDYAYLSVSTDDGRTWQTLPTRHTTTDNPIGNNLGNGYTGRSGGGEQATWQTDQADLTPFAGRRLQVRFEYVSDDAVSGPGFCVDDIAIPELGFLDDGEGAIAWESRGFVHSSNTIPQSYVARLISSGQQTTVTPLLIDAQGHASVSVSGAQRVIVAIAGTAPITSEPATFLYTVRNP